MKRLIYLMAAAAVLFTACKKEEKSSSEDLTGVWENNNAVLTLNANGSFSKVYSFDSSFEGTWSYDKGILNMTADGESAGFAVRFLAEKKALVLSLENEFGVDYELYYKKGATIKSGALKDGRYDAPHMGKKGTGNYDRTVTFIVKGNQMDLYIHAWGEHQRGTYKIENGVLKFNPTWGEHGESPDGWSAGEADIDFENFTFKNTSYHWVEGMRYQDVFTSIPMCVSEDGKDAYFSLANLTRWAFLR